MKPWRGPIKRPAALSIPLVDLLLTQLALGPGNICLSLSFQRVDPADHQSAVRSRLLKDDEQIWLSWHFIIYSELAEMGRFFFLLLGSYRIEVVKRILF